MRTKRRTKRKSKRSALKKKTCHGFRAIKKKHDIKDVPLSKQVHRGSEESCGEIDYHYQSYSNVMNIFEILPESGALCIFPHDEAFLTLDMENIEEGTVKRLGEMAENSNSDVTIISTESEEGVSLQKAFGGLAAILRYPIN